MTRCVMFATERRCEMTGRLVCTSLIERFFLFVPTTLFLAFHLTISGFGLTVNAMLKDSRAMLSWRILNVFIYGLMAGRNRNNNALI